MAQVTILLLLMIIGKTIGFTNLEIETEIVCQSKKEVYGAWTPHNFKHQELISCGEEKNILILRATWGRDGKN